ncbi:hypothetical protein HMPREF3218_0201136 [Prevotella bivia]|nr:hypothetical protein HMPREF3218_0201136 [Prevotella bivia]
MENGCYHRTLIDVKVASVKIARMTSAKPPLVNKLKCLETTMQI